MFKTLRSNAHLSLPAAVSRTNPEMTLEATGLSAVVLKDQEINNINYLT